MEYRRLFAASPFLILPTAGAVSQAPAPTENPDVDGNGIVDTTDLAIVRANLGRRWGQAAFDSYADVNSDCVVNVTDVSIASRSLEARFQPTIGPLVTPAASTDEWHNTNVTAAFACTRVSVSPDPVTNEGAGQTLISASARSDGQRRWLKQHRRHRDGHVQRRRLGRPALPESLLAWTAVNRHPARTGRA